MFLTGRIEQLLHKFWVKCELSFESCPTQIALQITRLMRNIVLSPIIWGIQLLIKYSCQMKAEYTLHGWNKKLKSGEHEEYVWKQQHIKQYNA